MLSGVPGIIERAFQLAEDCSTVEQIRTKLQKEGYSSVDAHLMGRSIRADLVRVIRKETLKAASFRPLQPIIGSEAT
ncbi:MAG TPA: hypothetical protein VGD23_10350 [Sphingomicrobium sp.]